MRRRNNTTKRKRNGTSKGKKRIHNKAGNASNKSMSVVRVSKVQTLIQTQEGVVESLIAPFKVSELPTLRFNTAAQFGSLFYRMNDLFKYNDGATNFKAVPYFVNTVQNYEKAWVISSSIEVLVQNREPVNSISVCVFPATSNTPVTTSGNFLEYASLPKSKRVTLSPSTGAMSTHKFLLHARLSQIYGPQYVEQDQYAMLPAVTDGPAGTSPSVLAFWGIAYFNATGNNTLTTGGLTVEVTLRYRVQFFDPLRTVSDVVMTIDAAKEKVRKAKEDLAALLISRDTV